MLKLGTFFNGGVRIYSIGGKRFVSQEAAEGIAPPQEDHL